MRREPIRPRLDMLIAQAAVDAEAARLELKHARRVIEETSSDLAAAKAAFFAAMTAAHTDFDAASIADSEASNEIDAIAEGEDV